MIDQFTIAMFNVVVVVVVGKLIYQSSEVLEPIYFLELISGKICYDFYDQPQRTSQIPYRLANTGAIGEPIKARLCNPAFRLAIVRRGRVQPCVLSENL